MAYDLKNVFYLSTSAVVDKNTAGEGSAQLDLSAYIDPIARGRAKGTGLAIYKVHYSILNSETTNIVAPDDGESGILTASLQAGLGSGDNATGTISSPPGAEAYLNTNALLVSAGNYYAPASTTGNHEFQPYVSPRKLKSQ